MPNNNSQYLNESSLMDAIIHKLTDYCNCKSPSKKTEIEELISQYQKEEISGYQSLIGRLSLIFGTSGGVLSKIKKEIAEMVAGYCQQTDSNEASSSSSAASSSSSAASTSADAIQIDKDFLLNSNKNEVILQLGQALLEGNALHYRNFVNIAKAYPEETSDALLTLREQCMQAAGPKNSASARVLLGLMLQIGLNEEERDYLIAISLYEQAVALGDSCAMSRLAFMYFNGHGVEQDYPKAVSLYEMAIALGDSSAMCKLAYMCLHGYGVAQDLPKARSLFRQAIALGNTDAMNGLAFMYSKGEGVAQDHSKAISLYRQAIALGDSYAMNCLAAIYIQGRFVAQNYLKAMLLYVEAIELGSADAMRCLAFMYEQSLGLAQDHSKAISLYRRAAALGDVHAMCILGATYETGLGVQENLREAERFYQMAVDNGVEEVEELLKIVQQQIKNTDPWISNSDLSEGDEALIGQYFFDTFKVLRGEITGDEQAVTVQLVLPLKDGHTREQLLQIFTRKGGRVGFEEVEGEMKVTIEKISVDDIRTLSLETHPATGIDEASFAASSSGVSLPEFESPEMEEAVTETETNVTAVVSTHSLFSPNGSQEQVLPKYEDEQKPYTFGGKA